MRQVSLSRDLVLIGGGHTHALVLRAWGMNPLPGARLTVINPGPAAAYSGMLPGFVAGHYSRADLDIDLYKLSAFAGARYILGQATALDPLARTVSIAGRPPIGYDVCSVDVGITSAMPGLPGFADHGVPAKPLAPFANRWTKVIEGTGPVSIAVIGGGVAGAELTMAMAHALRHRDATLHLVDRGRALREMTDRSAEIIRSRLDSLGVTLIEEAEVAEVTAEGLRLADGREIAAGLVVGAAGAMAWPWLAQSGLATEDGFLTVDARLQTSDAAVFAAGDCAHMAESPRPKAGVFAVRQAPVLAHNLRAALSGGALKTYDPQSDYLKLVSLGRKEALADKWGRSVSGKTLWHWKDRIDRRFMDRLSDLPAMEDPLPKERASGGEDAAMMCAGCGAKVGRGALAEALKVLPPPGDTIESVPGDDAAIVRVGGVRQVQTVDHLRAVTDDPHLMTRIAATHALGDLWAMGAQPRTALLSLILPRMTAELQARTLAEIMEAAQSVMGAAGAAIVGGHTSMGSEMTIGFALTGACETDPITLAGGRPGDILVLTKPLGSGTLLAGAMRGLVAGAELAACHDWMVQGQGAAAAILSDARAMTDVTGFGLAGHLRGICDASGVGAELELAALPVMAGALEAAEAGVRSTLFDDNVSGAGAVEGALGARGALLFDPQTSGGLLAVVPAEVVGERLGELREAGYTAARIGRLTEGSAIRCR